MFRHGTVVYSVYLIGRYPLPYIIKKLFFCQIFYIHKGIVRPASSSYNSLLHLKSCIPYPSPYEGSAGSKAFIKAVSGTSHSTLHTTFIYSTKGKLLGGYYKSLCCPGYKYCRVPLHGRPHSIVKIIFLCYIRRLGTVFPYKVHKVRRNIVTPLPGKGLYYGLRYKLIVAESVYIQNIDISLAPCHRKMELFLNHIPAAGEYTLDSGYILPDILTYI